MAKNGKRGGVAITENGDAIYSPGADVQETMPDGSPVTNGSAPVKRVESKAERFKRLVNARMPKALKLIRRMVPLATRSQYEYTPEQVASIITALRMAVDEVQKALTGTPTGRPTFHLE